MAKPRQGQPVSLVSQRSGYNLTIRDPAAMAALCVELVAGGRAQVFSPSPRGLVGRKT